MLEQQIHQQLIQPKQTKPCLLLILTKFIFLAFRLKYCTAINKNAQFANARAD